MNELQQQQQDPTLTFDTSQYDPEGDEANEAVIQMMREYLARKGDNNG